MGIKESVFIKRPGEPVRHVNMSLTLENLQRYVGGFIECLSVGVYHDQEVVLVCNEEGKLRGLAPCLVSPYDVIVGDVVFLRAKGEELVGLEGSLKDFTGWLEYNDWVLDWSIDSKDGRSLDASDR